MIQVAAFSIVVVTVGLALGRPRFGTFQIHHGKAGVIGAALTLLFGIAPLEAVPMAARLLAAPILTIVSLMVMTQVAESSGLFARLGHVLASRARGSGRRLFAYIFLTGTLVGTFFTNDAAVLIFTPIVFALVEQIGGDSWRAENKLPFYFAVLYVANLVGALVIANPINLVVASLLDISFLEFARGMALPGLASILFSFAGLWLYFRNDIPRQFALPLAAAPPSRQKKLQLFCALTVALALLGFFTESLTGIPTHVVALAGAVTLTVMHKRLGGFAVTPLVRGVDWQVLVFMVGMFIVGLGLRNVGFTHLLGHAIETLAGGASWALRGVTGIVAALCSAAINNHPTADLMAFTIQDFGLPSDEAKSLGFAALIGGDLGPKMLPIGSLAALIWFRLLRLRGVEISYGLYIKIGIPVTLAALLASLLVLELQMIFAAAAPGL